MVFLGLAIAALLYLLAETLNLYLTYLTLRYFVGVSLIIFVIIFQYEIRKYFEFLGLIGSRNIKVGRLTPKSLSASEIIQACVQMAQAKTGSLIVIQGKDNLDNYIEGGTALDGVISEDIIVSIFDPHSDGHDGAVIIDNDRILKFGAHLPLSTNFKEIGKHGTRHSAALGLAENTDALSIVCSEEKGQISICRDRKLKTLAQFADLERELNKFIKDKFTIKKENAISHIIKHNFILKVGAVVCAVLIWFFTAYQAGIVEKSYNIPITIEELPENVVIEDYNPKEIRLTVSGRGDSTFSNIDPSEFQVKFEAKDLQNDINKKTISRKNITVPPSLLLISYEPNSILLTAKKYYEAKVRISAKVAGSLPDELELKNTEITPEEVALLVPEGSDTPTEIITETVDISNQTESVIIPVKLIVPENIRLSNGDNTINIALTIEKK